jgi:cysteine synthase A
MKIYNDVIGLIGNTPMVRISKLNRLGVAEVYVKIESRNPSLSVKDRLAKAMIEDAENRGVISENTIIIEPSSGNTGIGLAMVCAVKGYKLIVTMPESMSVERRKLMTALGTEIVLTPAEKGMKGAIARASELCIELNGFMPMQFENLSNVEMHMKTTAMEIWNDTDGEIDGIVTGIGTGGTFTGVSKALKAKKSSFFSIAVEPQDSPVLSGGSPAPHKIQGIGAGFIPSVVDVTLIDEVVKVSHQDAVNTARKLMKEEGILCGISSGANVWAALEVAKRKEFENKKIVTFVCDSAERYLSTILFND